jgi:alkyl hydroperoxide reductase subunit F
MLDADLKTQLQVYLEKVVHPIELVASVDDSEKSQELLALLQDIESMSPRISLRRADGARKPSFSIDRLGTDVSVSFAGIPMGHEFTSLVLALLQVGGHPSKAAPELIEQIQNIEGEFVFETFMSLSCHSCPDTVQALNLISVINPNIKHVAVDGALFQSEVDERQVMSVPTVFLNGELFDTGRMSVEQIVTRIDAGAAKRDAEKMKAKKPFDVLVVGGGPAGAASTS